MTNENIFSKKLVKKEITTISFSITFQNLIVFLLNMSSIFILGLQGGIHLSAATLANQVYFLVYLAITGLAEGSNVMISRFWGENNHDAIHHTLAYTLRNTLVFGCIISLITFIFPKEIMRILTTDKTLITLGCEYLKIVGISYLFFCVSTIMYNILRAVEIVLPSLIISIIACITNISLTLFFMFPLNAGIQGVAIAVLISRIIECTLISIYTIYKQNQINFKKIKLLYRNPVFAKRFYKTIAPLVSNELLWALGDSVIIIVFGRLGSDFINAQSVYSLLSQLTSVNLGFASAACIICGKTIGQKNYDKLNYVIKTFKRISIFIGIINALIMIFGIFIIPIIYDYPDLSNLYIKQLLLCATIIEFFKSIQGMNMMGILRGGGDMKFILWNDMTFLWLYAIPVCLLSAFVFHLPVYMIFGLTKADQIIKFFTSEIRYKSNKWIQDV